MGYGYTCQKTQRLRIKQIKKLYDYKEKIFMEIKNNDLFKKIQENKLNKKNHEFRTNKEKFLISVLSLKTD